MPITKPRPDISELVQAAVEQHLKRFQDTYESLERPISVWFTDEDLLVYRYFLQLSRSCKLLLANSSVAYMRFAIALLASAIIAIESNFYPLQLSSSVVRAEIVTNSFVLLDAIVRLLSIPMHFRVEAAFEREIDIYDFIPRSGLLELAVSITCFALMDRGIVIWFQLLRALILASIFIEFFPFMNILITGIKNSIRSLSFTILLLFLFIMVYASLCNILFAENDPFRFGTLGLSALTLFTLTTFNAWSVAYYINYGGCDSFPSEYSQLGSVIGTGRIVTKFGVFYQPVCENPSSNEIVASIIFISFSFLCGYFITNMSLAAVAIGFKEKLNELVKVVDDGGQISEKPGMHNEKVAKLMGSNRQKQQLKKMLHVIWGEAKESGSIDEKKLRCKKIKSIKELEELISSTIATRSYDYVLSSLFLAETILEIYESTMEVRGPIGFGFHVFFQLVFTLDIVLKYIGSLKYGWKKFFRRFWVLFDLVVTSFSWLPLAAPNNDSFKFLTFLRILRLMRILRNLSFIKDLGVIIKSIAGSFDSVLYLLWLLVLLIFYSSCLATLMFRGSDPYRFGDLLSSVRSLIQLMTTDDCWNTMRISMLGCKYYGYNVGVPNYDNMCTTSDPSAADDAVEVGITILGSGGASISQTKMFTSSEAPVPK
jgi:hypothetical protein